MALPILDGNQTAATLSTIITGGAHIPAHTVVSLGSQAISDISNAVSSVQVSGTVTANLGLLSDTSGNGSAVFPVSGVDVNAIRTVIYSGGDFGSDQGAPVDGNNPLPISGTVTANVMGFDCVNNEYSPIPVLPYNEPIDCGNTVIARITDTNGTDLNLSNGVPISGTVTVGAMPNGALTTRFGSVTTANTAQITSAVTNTSRKYLLAQNISAGTVTIGIGFSPTTTQGIQLTAGAGLTFDAFCPTGAVYWLGAVTGAAFTILEG